jgi:6-phosphogluconolactonase
MLKVYESPHALYEAAAAQFVSVAQAAVAKNGRFLVALSGGGTPNGLYNMLAQSPLREQLPWQQTHVIWGDERLVPPTNSDSNYQQAFKALLQHVPIPFHQIHRALGEADAQTAVAHYTHQLAQLAPEGKLWPKFDLVLLGMGIDGHTASLFPYDISVEEATNPVIHVTGAYDGRPTQRITLTPLVINEAHHISFLVMGSNKRDALTAVCHGTHNPQKWPAQRIQPQHGTLTWFVDAAAVDES